MTRRVFLAVNLPLSVGKAIEDEILKIKTKLPEEVRFLPTQNWHITLLFFGNQTDENIVKISETARRVTSEFAPIEAAFERIVYGPSSAKPRMIWLATDYDTSSRLETIKQMIENRLDEQGINSKREKRKLNGHITLARFGKKTGVSELPRLNQELKLNFFVRSLDFMESKLKPSGANYSVLEKFEFFY